MPHKEVTKLVYRSVLRFANAADGVPFALKDKHLAEVFPGFGSAIESAQLGFGGSEHIRRLLRTGFKDNRGQQDEDASEALESAFTALRLLNTYYADQIRSMREIRDLHSDRSSISYPVGQVFHHRRHGYAGVVYGWDSTCGHGQEWADKMGVDLNQPFYQVLPDEDDCQRLYGSIRITKYVAEENIMPVQAPRRITHRLLENFFDGYSPSQMRYVPGKQVQFQFPDEYNSSDTVPCREDTNLLRSVVDENADKSMYHSVDPLRRSMQEMRRSLSNFEQD